MRGNLEAGNMYWLAFSVNKAGITCVIIQRSVTGQRCDLLSWIRIGKIGETIYGENDELDSTKEKILKKLYRERTAKEIEESNRRAEGQESRIVGQVNAVCNVIRSKIGQ